MKMKYVTEQNSELVDRFLLFFSQPVGFDLASLLVDDRDIHPSFFPDSCVSWWLLIKILFLFLCIQDSCRLLLYFSISFKLNAHPFHCMRTQKKTKNQTKRKNESQKSISKLVIIITNTVFFIR